VGTSCVNAAFEEIFVSGYIITALKPSRGASFALNVSVAVRLLYHLYQGQMAMLGVLPVGLVYAFWYARSGRLWPLIVAHALQDVVSLLY
jgi:membrane protease YdiL (CAAX protease family)